MYFSKEGPNKRVLNVSPIQNIVEQYDSLLSDLLKQNLLASDRILAEFNGTNSKDLSAKLDDLKNLGSLQLNVDDLFVLFVAVEIGKNSVQYWEENIFEWERLLNPESMSSRIYAEEFSWNEVAGADVAGGVGAAVTTAFLNAAPGPGQVSYGTAIVATAAGASAGDAALQLWNKFWGE